MFISTINRQRFRLYQAEGSSLAALSVSILTALLSNQLLTFIDTVMAGWAGAVELAGVAVGGSLWLPVFLFMYGVLMAVTPMVAQLHGAGRTGESGPLARSGILVAIPLVLTAALFLCNAEWAFAWMGVDDGIAHVAAGYLKAISWGLPAAALFFLMRNLSEGMGLARPSMLIGLVSLPVNALVNYLLIYGKMGLPALGGIGCGWATAITLWFMCALMLLTIRIARPYRAACFFGPLKTKSVKRAAEIVRLGLPIGCSLLVESSVFALIALFLAPLGALTVSAHQITLNYSSLVFMLPLSMSSAITIRVGHAVGMGRHDRARLVSRAGLVINAIIALFTSALTLFFSQQIASIYTDDRQVIAMAAGLLVFNALYQFPDSLQVAAAATLRGYKDTRATLVMVVLAYWVVSLPLGYSLGLTHFWGEPMGAAGFWISLVVGLGLASLLLLMRLRYVERTTALADRKMVGI